MSPLQTQLLDLEKPFIAAAVQVMRRWQAFAMSLPTMHADSALFASSICGARESFFVTISEHSYLKIMNFDAIEDLDVKKDLVHLHYTALDCFHETKNLVEAVMDATKPLKKGCSKLHIPVPVWNKPSRRENERPAAHSARVRTAKAMFQRTKEMIIENNARSVPFTFSKKKVDIFIQRYKSFKAPRGWKGTGTPYVKGESLKIGDCMFLVKFCLSWIYQDQYRCLQQLFGILKVLLGWKIVSSDIDWLEETIWEDLAETSLVLHATARMLWWHYLEWKDELAQRHVRTHPTHPECDIAEREVREGIIGSVLAGYVEPDTSDTSTCFNLSLDPSYQDAEKAGSTCASYFETVSDIGTRFPELMVAATRIVGKVLRFVRVLLESATCPGWEELADVSLFQWSTERESADEPEHCVDFNKNKYVLTIIAVRDIHHMVLIARSPNNRNHEKRYYVLPCEVDAAGYGNMQDQLTSVCYVDIRPVVHIGWGEFRE
eukprot:g44156.t1